jgi:hypothetical protein
MARLPSLTGCMIAAAALATGCGDEPLAPAGAAPAPPEVFQPLGLGGAEQASLLTAFLFAGQQSARGLQQREPAQFVSAALTTLAARIEANDPAGIERAIRAARLAVGQYRDRARDPGAAPDLEAMDITLLRAASLVRAAATHSSTELERQP